MAIVPFERNRVRKILGLAKQMTDNNINKLPAGDKVTNRQLLRCIIPQAENTV